MLDLPLFHEQERPDHVHARALQPGVRLEAIKTAFEEQAEHGGLDHVVFVVREGHDVAAQRFGGGVQRAAAEIGTEGAGVVLLPDVKYDLGDLGVNDLQRHLQAFAEGAERRVVNALEPQRHVHRLQLKMLRVEPPQLGKYRQQRHAVLAPGQPHTHPGSLFNHIVVLHRLSGQAEQALHNVLRCHRVCPFVQKSLNRGLSPCSKKLAEVAETQAAQRQGFARNVVVHDVVGIVNTVRQLEIEAVHV